jgi:peptidoglycan/xylan/chitin deacetylase (PgdA/CDA1 family)
LLYHHVSSDGGGSRYFVDTENFRQQMKALRRWGYTSITPSYLAQVLVHGGELPARPVIITFDDGNLDVYTNAFPIMQKMGFIGTMYIVTERLNSYNLVNAEQLAEMTAAGWEIGSHTMSHSDLTYNHWQLDYELQQSRSLLEDTLSVPVLTLAYPYGLRDDYVVEWAKEYGYIAGMGLGTFNEHTLDTLFFLSRREVYSEYDMTAFSALLPWTQPFNSP